MDRIEKRQQRMKTGAIVGVVLGFLAFSPVFVLAIKQWSTDARFAGYDVLAFSVALMLLAGTCLFIIVDFNDQVMDNVREANIAVIRQFADIRVCIDRLTDVLGSLAKIDPTLLNSGDVTDIMKNLMELLEKTSDSAQRPLRHHLVARIREVSQNSLSDGVSRFLRLPIEKASEGDRRRLLIDAVKRVGESDHVLALTLDLNGYFLAFWAHVAVDDYLRPSVRRLFLMSNEALNGSDKGRHLLLVQILKSYQSLAIKKRPAVKVLCLNDIDANLAKAIDRSFLVFEGFVSESYGLSGEKIDSAGNVVFGDTTREAELRKLFERLWQYPDRAASLLNSSVVPLAT